MHTYLYVLLYMPMCTYEWKNMVYAVSFSVTLHSKFWKQDFSLNLKHSELARHAGHQGPMPS